MDDLKKSLHDAIVAKENDYANYVITKIREAKIDRIAFLPSFNQETIHIIYHDVLTIRRHFEKTYLENKIKLWRREVLKAVLGDETISIADDRVTNFEKYQKTLLNKDVKIFIGTNPKNIYESCVKGIVGLGVDESKAFFPSLSETFLNSSDKNEEELLTQSQPQ